MKVSPPPPPLSSVTPATEREDDDDGSTDAAAANNCGGGGGLKRRRLHSQTNVINNHYNRHRKHFYSRHDDRSSPSSTDRLNDVGGTASTGSSCNSGGDVSDCDGDPSSKAPDGGHPPTAHRHPIAAEEGTSFSPPPPPPRIQKTTIINNNNNNVSNDGNETNKIILESTVPSILMKNATAINENYQPTVTDTDFDHTVTANDYVVNNETINCLSQSPLNLTRSQGSSEEDGKSDYDEDEYDDDNEEKNNCDNDDDENNIVNGHNLPMAEAPFPWNVNLGNNNNNNNNNKQKQHHNDKITASSTPPPQLLLTSGHLTTGCLQAVQLLIPTARGIMTQTILAIPINDMVSSEIAASDFTQRQLLHQSSNNVRQKHNVNRQQLNQTYCQPQLNLPLSRYFQHQSADDETTKIPNALADHDNKDASGMVGDSQRRKWQSTDVNSKKHHFVSPQQLIRTKNDGGGAGESTSAQRVKDSSTILQTSSGTNGDNRIYTNSSSSSAFGRTDTNTDVTQRQTVWPTSVINASDQNVSDENENEGKLYSEDKQQTQPSHGIAMSSANINTLKSLTPSSTQLNCSIKESKYDSAAAAAAYNQQNAICTALATHMMCASQLAQQPMFDNLDNCGNAIKKPNQFNNNNNNNNVKTSNNMMGVVNPAVLEKWMMEERYYYNNNNNNNNNNNSNNKNNSAGNHVQNQRYNSTAVAVAAAAAVELLNVSTSPSADSLASCKKRKRRTSFTPQALELLNGHFERNTHPSGSEITGLAHRLGYEREVIRIWFCNKRQALKNTVRSINGSTHMTISKSHSNNTSGY